MDAVRQKLVNESHQRVAGRVISCIVMIMLYFFSYFQRVAIPGTIFDELQMEFTLSASTVAGLGSVFIFVYAFSQLFVGVLADRLGGRRLLLAGGVLMCLGEMLFPLSKTIFALYACRIITSLGASGIYLSIVKEIDTLFPAKNFSLILGIAIFFGYSGGLFGTLPFERLVSRFGWRNSLVLIGVVSCLVLGVCFFVLQRFKTPEGGSTPISFHPYRSVLENRYSYPILISGSINFALYFVIQTTLGKKFLQDVAGVSSKNAAMITFVMMFCSMLLSLIAGMIPKLFDNRRKVFVQLSTGITFVASVLSLVSLITGAGEWAFLVLFAVFAVSSGFGPLFTCLIREVNSPRNVGVSVSLHNCNCYLQVAIFSSAAGAVLEGFRSSAIITEHAIIYPEKAYVIIFCGIVALSVISLVSSFFIQETRGRFILAPSSSMN